MYTLSRKQYRGYDTRELKRQARGSSDIAEYWVEDEAGNVIEHYDASEDDYDEDDGQPTEYEEWQDYMGGDDWDHGQYEY
jgi:hypothetical protein